MFGNNYVKADAIEINTCADLGNIGADEGKPLDGSYVLKADLVCDAISVSGIFAGTFDGENHIITDIIDNVDYVALFANANGATFSNLNIAGSMNGNDYVGALVGHGINLNINNIHSTAIITGSSYVGG